MAPSASRNSVMLLIVGRAEGQPRVCIPGLEIGELVVGKQRLAFADAAAQVVPKNQCPAFSSRRRPKVEGLSNREKQSQSIDPPSLTSAALCRSDRSA